MFDASDVSSYFECLTQTVQTLPLNPLISSPMYCSRHTTTVKWSTFLAMGECRFGFTLCLRPWKGYRKWHGSAISCPGSYG